MDRNKLTIDDIDEIKYFYRLGAKNHALSKAYSISSATVSNYTTISKEKQKEANHRYYLRESEEQKIYRKMYSQTERGKFQIANAHLKRLYGITIEQKNEMRKNQSYCCAICGRHESLFKKGLAVDHNHTTGKVRGLLCTDCNTRIETLENKNFCSKASLYIQGYL